MAIDLLLCSLVTHTNSTTLSFAIQRWLAFANVPKTSSLNSQNHSESTSNLIFMLYYINLHPYNIIRMLISSWASQKDRKKVTSLLNSLIIIAVVSYRATSIITIQLKKDNIYIAQNSNYSFSLNLSQTTSQINPINVSIYHQISNSLSTTNQYFDYFKYLSPDDILCYQYAIGNSSYLFPCPFLLNNDFVLRIPSVTDYIKRQDQNLRGLNQIQQDFIIDNTPYPFPIGAYPYSPIRVTTITGLSISFDESYKDGGIRLIFINTTLIAVYLVVIGILVYRTRKIQQQMLQRAPNYNLKKRTSDLSRDRDKRDDDEESDIDNYQRIISLRQSRDSKMPSLLSSQKEHQMSRNKRQ